MFVRFCRDCRRVRRLQCHSWNPSLSGFAVRATHCRFGRVSLTCWRLRTISSGAQLLVPIFGMHKHLLAVFKLYFWTILFFIKHKILCLSCCQEINKKILSPRASGVLRLARLETRSELSRADDRNHTLSEHTQIHTVTHLPVKDAHRTRLMCVHQHAGAYVNKYLDLCARLTCKRAHIVSVFSKAPIDRVNNAVNFSFHMSLLDLHT